jgi:hypothetical protein
MAVLVIGGDPESAYVVAIYAAGYAFGFAAGQTSFRRLRPIGVGLLVLAAVQMSLEIWLARVRAGKAENMAELAAVPYSRALAALAWSIILAVTWSGWRDATGPWRRLWGIAGAAALALVVCGGQLLPTIEFFAASGRNNALGLHDVYPFSLKPLQCVGWVWPNVCGTIDHGNRLWADTLPPVRPEWHWCTSLYMGALPLVLAVAAAGVRGGPPWRGWLKAVAVVGLVASTGEYGSPLFWAREVPQWDSVLGPHDLVHADQVRIDGYLRDGDGGPYWFLGAWLPGFDAFRFPSKLLTLTCLGIAGLAGMGWDHVTRGQMRTAVAWASTLLLLTCVVIGLLASHQEALAKALTLRKELAIWVMAPLDVRGALADVWNSLVQSALALSAALVLIILAGVRPRLAGVLGIILVSVDVSFAGRRFVVTVPQTLFDETPRLKVRIDELEKTDPARGPYRVFRAQHWVPLSALGKHAASDNEDLVRWSRNTLEPLVGEPLGVQYAFRQGTAETFAMRLFFTPLKMTASAKMASALKVEPGSAYWYYPRLAFDLWGARYFILPGYIRWDNPARGIASFLPRTEAIPLDSADRKNATSGGPGAGLADVRLLRNLDAYPRAWVVHKAHLLRPIREANVVEQWIVMERLLYSRAAGLRDGDDYRDMKKNAWIEIDDFAALSPYLSNASPGGSERVSVVVAEPQRMELLAELESPGVVVLAESYYPGWTLAIDGRPTAILRVNRLMRGAAVSAGRHRLVYEYHPRSFRYGMVLSAAGLVILGLYTWRCRVCDVPTDSEPAPDPFRRQKLRIGT